MKSQIDSKLIYWY